MIKVVARKIKNQPMEAICWDCAAKIEYEGQDVVDNRIKCPDCGASIWVGEEGKEVPKFPESFYHFGEKEEAVKLSDKKINEYVKEVADELRYGEIGDFFFTGTGDTLVAGVKTEDCDTIFVCKNYYEHEYNFRD